MKKQGLSNPKKGQFVFDEYSNTKKKIQEVPKNGNDLYFIGKDHEPVRRNEFVFPVPKQGLNNPALIAAAATPAGQQAITKTIDTANNAVSGTLSIVKNVLGIGVFLGVGYFAYTKIFNGFTAVSEDPQYTPSNVSTGVAKAKAEAIYTAMYGAGNGFNMVKSILQYVNGERINHNGFIRVYNAFGKRDGVLPFSKNMTLTEWFIDQFSQSELLELRLIIKDFF